jgi:rod shape-determining protein MreB
MLIDTEGNYLIIIIQENLTQIRVLSGQKYLYYADFLEGTIDIDKLIISFFARELNLHIGFRTAQGIRTEIGSAVEQQTVSEIKVRSRVIGSEISGVKIQEVTVTDGQIRNAISGYLSNLAKEVNRVVKQFKLLDNPSSDDSKILLHGEGSSLNGLGEWLEKETGLSVITIPSPNNLAKKSKFFRLFRLFGKNNLC